MAELDYKELLKKYIRHVVDREGISFIDDANPEFEPYIKFTPDEYIELERIAGSIRHD